MPGQELQDKAGKEYWDRLWKDSDLPSLIDPRNTSNGNYVFRRLDELFRATLSDALDKDLSLLEVGCAQSVWLPYFAKEFGFEITGLDYSEHGCEQERTILASAGIDGTIICGDLFSPPPSLLESFDVLVTFGVVEHFTDTAEMISKLAVFLKPGGRIITVIPNMRGMCGRVQKLVNEPVFRTHVPISRDELGKAHESAGIQVDSCMHTISMNFYVINLVGSAQGGPAMVRNWLLISALKVLTRAVWAFESVAFRLREVETLSPYIVCVGTKR